MEKVDEVIEVLAEHISKIVFSGKEDKHEIAEKTKALADLISARASLKCSFETLPPVITAK